MTRILIVLALVFGFSAPLTSALAGGPSQMAAPAQHPHASQAHADVSPKVTKAAKRASMLAILFALVITGAMFACYAAIFAKAGEPAWGAFVPFYNMYLMFRISGTPAWVLVLMFVPFLNVIASWMLTDGIVKGFGKTSMFTLGVLFLPFIFLPMLAFGSAQYVGHGSPSNPSPYRRAA